MRKGRTVVVYWRASDQLTAASFPPPVALVAPTTNMAHTYSGPLIGAEASCRAVPVGTCLTPWTDTGV